MHNFKIYKIYKKMYNKMVIVRRGLECLFFTQKR